MLCIDKGRTMARFIANDRIERLRRRVLAKKLDRVASEQLFALAIAEHVFGSDWLRKHLWGSEYVETFGSERRRPYLQSEEGGRDRILRSHFRLIEAMSFVLRFQASAHARPVINKLELCGLEETIAELRVADLLDSWGLEFRFRRPTGIKGTDYDIDVELRDGTWAAGEIKCKLGETDLSMNGIVRTLSKAKQQLPGDRPSVIFLQIPEAWMMTYDDAGEVVRGAIVAFLRSTTRVSSVIELLAYAPDELDHTIPFRLVAERANERCRFGALQLVDYDKVSRVNGADRELSRVLFAPTHKRVQLGDMPMSDQDLPTALHRYCGW
jgi:hypothetical protein